MTASQASWVTGARSADGEGTGEGFGLANLPMGAWSGEGRGARLGVRIGEDILDLFRCVESGVLRRLDQRIQDALARPVLNDQLALGPAAWSATRTELQRLLDASCPDLRDAAIAKDALLPAWGITMRLPCDIGDYTDFYASIHHATNVGSMFRPTNPLMPNWKHLPVGYHGRASTVVASGAAVRRPMGQTVQADDGPPSLTACRLLDYELELGAIVGGPANEIGQRVSVAEAAGRIYGHVLLNDWSARDLQKWEYQPLGPFTAKNFITSISPWVVSADALAPYRVPMPPRGDGDPQPLEYLRWDGDFLLDVRFEVAISSAPMRERGVPAMVVSRSRGTDLWWSMNQMLAHHTVSGCRMRAGDLIGSGTISGSYFKDPTGQTRGVGVMGSGTTNEVTGLSSSQMLQRSSFSAWFADSAGGISSVGGSRAN
jgi:fumarylacetoacetase